MATTASNIRQAQRAVLDARLGVYDPELLDDLVRVTVALFPQPRPKGERKASLLFVIGKAIASVWGRDFDLNKGKIMRSAKLLAGKDASPQDVLTHYAPGTWWYTDCDDWRAKKGQRPTPELIVEHWGRWNEQPAEHIQQAENGGLYL